MKKVFVVALAIIVVSGLILSGCAAPAAPPAEEVVTPAPPPEEEEEVVAPVSEKYGGVLKLMFFRPASRIGVPLNIRHSDHWYAEHACQKLLVSSEAQAGAYEPELAESWELAPDRSSYTFHLRKGVKFHDGTDFNAEVVKWNLDKVVVSERPQLDTVTSIDIIDDYTIRFNLSSWDNQALDGFGQDPGFIISPTAFERNGEEWANTNPIGTGPFKVNDFVRNQYIKYEKFEDYWEEGVPYLDGIEVHHIQDSMTSMACFLKGDLDVLYSIDPTTASELQATGKYNIQTTSGPGGTIVLNSTNPESIWYDKRMREALEYAIDKETISEVLGLGFSTPSYEIIKGLHEAGGDPGTVPRKYDPDKARELIAAAGYPEGVKVTLTVNADAPNQDTNVAIQQQLSEVGIQIELNPVTGATLNEMSFKPAPGSDLRQEALRGGPGNPLRGVKETLSENSMYFPGLKRPAGFEDLLQQALQEEDAAKVMTLMEQMDKLAYEDAMFVPLSSSSFIHVLHPYVQDCILLYGGGPHPKLQYCWLSEK